MTEAAEAMRSFGDSRDAVLGPGDVLTLLPDSIHSVINETQSITVSVHVYGKHVNHTERSRQLHIHEHDSADQRDVVAKAV